MSKETYSINRSIAILKPTQTFIDWANSLPDSEQKITPADLKDDCTTVLIPEYDTDKEAKEYVDSICFDLFEHELEGWCLNRDWWPKKRTKESFWKWFAVEFHSVILDLAGDYIERQVL